MSTPTAGHVWTAVALRGPDSRSVLEWTIMRDSRDIRQLMVWLEESEGRKERAVFMSRALDLMDEIQYALSRLDELR